MKDEVTLNGAIADQLRGYVSRLEQLEQDVVEVNRKKAAIYSEARAVGFSINSLKHVLGVRRNAKKDGREREDAVALYQSDVPTRPY